MVLLTLAGVKQNTERLGDVVLPPWAKGDPYEFVRVNREVIMYKYITRMLPFTCTDYMLAICTYELAQYHCNGYRKGLFS